MPGRPPMAWASHIEPVAITRKRCNRVRAVPFRGVLLAHIRLDHVIDAPRLARTELHRRMRVGLDVFDQDLAIGIEEVRVDVVNARRRECHDGHTRVRGHVDRRRDVRAVGDEPGRDDAVVMQTFDAELTPEGIEPLHTSVPEGAIERGAASLPTGSLPLGASGAHRCRRRLGMPVLREARLPHNRRASRTREKARPCERDSWTGTGPFEREKAKLTAAAFYRALRRAPASNVLRSERFGPIPVRPYPTQSPLPWSSMSDRFDPQSSRWPARHQRGNSARVARSHRKRHRRARKRSRPRTGPYARVIPCWRPSAAISSEPARSMPIMSARDRNGRLHREHRHRSNRPHGDHPQLDFVRPRRWSGTPGTTGWLSAPSSCASK